MTKRQEMEYVLERTYMNKMVSFITLTDKEVIGRMNSIAYEDAFGEPMVIIIIDRDRYEVDLQYFNENIELL